ncbi:MAG: ABC transporter ATP-binding protein [Clostridia bacterium]|nr:ABC transporter ATP-binding protein [Clostridia bacterium]
MIEIKNLSFSFGDKVIFDNFSLEIPHKSVTAITGKSGCGKSTLINLICGLLKADKGEIISDAKSYAVVFQEDRLLPWLTVRENVSIVSDDKTADLWLKKVGLSESAELYPSQLSGGMKRRTALARALAYGSDVLILDEAFNGVDEETKSVLMDIIKEQAKEKAVILISHNSDEIQRLADKIYSLD